MSWSRGDGEVWCSRTPVVRMVISARATARRVTDWGKSTCMPALLHGSTLGLALSGCPFTAGAGQAPRPFPVVRGGAGPGPPPACPAEMLPGRLVSTVSHVPGDGWGLVGALILECQGGGRATTLCSEDLSASPRSCLSQGV